jgi:hypothetical protein
MDRWRLFYFTSHQKRGQWTVTRRTVRRETDPPLHSIGLHVGQYVTCSICLGHLLPIEEGQEIGAADKDFQPRPSTCNSNEWDAVTVGPHATVLSIIVRI